MTLLDQPRRDADVVGAEVIEEAERATAVIAGPGDAGRAPIDDGDVETPEPREEISVRPLLAAGLSSSASAFLAAGIFGSWGARAVALSAVWFGVAWAYMAWRSSRRTAWLASLVPASFVFGIVSLIPSGGGPSQLPTLVRDAVRSGRLLRPPVPFDPGWRPLLILLLASIAFASAWIAGPLRRSKLAVAIPLPLVGLFAISQPDDAQVLGGVVAFVCVLAALAVLFGTEGGSAGLDREFEMKRAARGAAAAVPLLAAAVFVFNNTTFLFPDPVYDPGDEPQKPKPIPLSTVQDRVLFEVETETDITGPWRVGVLDVYDGESWRLPPFDTDRFVPVPGGDTVAPDRLAQANVGVTFTIRDLGDSAAVPSIANPARIDTTSRDLVFDPRPAIFRVDEGRAASGLTYTVLAPAYPTADDLEAARPPESEVRDYLDIPKPPATVRDLLAAAPGNPWRRLEFLRKQLNDVVIAAGAGTPKDITPSRVEQIFIGNHEATPFEIVAAEAMLARWAGVPSRIGFGFDGLNDENGTLTVRPRNAAQFLEVYFEGYGWVPLSSSPPKAKSTLDTDPNARFKPSILPSDDVGVEIYIPYRDPNPWALYQRIRARLLQAAPVAALVLVGYLLMPAGLRAWRRRKRRQWAQPLGARAQIAVEYTEFRDLATDLNVGDPYDTALEYLARIADDDEHAELAWLVARSMYGDLATEVTDVDVRAAEAMSASLRRRLLRAQPMQTRVAAFLARTSLERPYTLEVPNVRIPRLPRPRLRVQQLWSRRARRRFRWQRA